MERSTCDFQYARDKTQEEIKHLGIKCIVCQISQELTEEPWIFAHASGTPMMPFRKKNCPAAWLSSDGNTQIGVFDTKSWSAPLEKKNDQGECNQTNHFHSVGDELRKCQDLHLASK